MKASLEFLDQAGKSFAGFASPILMQSAILILALFLLDRVLEGRVRATVRYGIWMLVLIKLVLPASFSLPTGIGYWVRPMASPNGISTAGRFSEAADHLSFHQAGILSRWAEASVELSASTPSGKPAFTPPLDAPTRPHSFPAMSVHAWLLLLWLAGVAALTAGVARNGASLRALLRRARTAPPSMLRALRAAQTQLRLRWVCGLQVSDEVSAPIVCGWWRPVIVIPGRLVALSGDRLQAVLLHELAHVKRGDLWVNSVQTLLQIAYFYNPLLWLANARIRRLREHAVDETVLVALGDAALEYPETLLEIARQSRRQPRLRFATVGILERRSSLAQRIRDMLERPLPTTAKLGVAGVAAMVLLGAILLPMGAPSNAEATTSRSGGLGDPSVQPARAGAPAAGLAGERGPEERSSPPGQQSPEELFHHFLSLDTSHLLDPEANRIIEAFWELGEEAVPVLAAALTKGKGDLDRGTTYHRRRQAAYLLAQLETAAQGALRELTAALEDETIIAVWAAKALGNLGPPAREAVPALIESLQFGNVGAATALIKIAPDPERLVPVFLEVLTRLSNSTDDWQHRFDIVRALEILGPGARRAIPQLLKFLEEEEMRLPAAQALRSIGRGSPEVLERAETLLQRLGPPESGHEEVPPLLILMEHLESADYGMRSSAFRALNSMGTNAAPAVPIALRILAEHEHTWARISAAGLLSRIQPQDDASIDALIRALKDPVAMLRQTAAIALGNIGPAAKPAVPALQPLLHHRQPLLRVSAMTALWKIDRRPPDLPALLSHLGLLLDLDPDNMAWVRCEILGILTELGPAARETEPAVRQLLNDWDPGVREKAAEALKHITGS